MRIPRLASGALAIMLIASLNGVRADDNEVAAVAAKRVMQLSAEAVVDKPLPVQQLSLVRWTSDGFQPVPFQIDEMAPHNAVWFEELDLDHLGEAGVFDRQDKLLAMTRDAGQRAPSDAELDEGSMVTTLKVTRPAAPATFFYLVRNHSARSSRRYIHHNVDAGTTRTPWYRLKVEPDNELNWDFLGYDSYEGDGSIIDTLKMRMSAGVLSKFARVTLTNDNLDPHLEGIRIGPIRSVMNLETKVVISGIPVMTMDVQVFRYPNYYEARTRASVPMLYRATLKKPRVSVSIDGHDQYGAQVKTARSGQLEAQVDGHMSPDEKALVERGLSTNENWILFDSKRQFSVLTLLDVPDKLSGIPLGLVYQDDKDAELNPEHYPGQLPNVGYTFLGWPDQKDLQFSVKLFFDRSLHGLQPEEYVALRRGTRGDIKVLPRAAE